MRGMDCRAQLEQRREHRDTVSQIQLRQPHFPVLNAKQQRFTSGVYAKGSCSKWMCSEANENSQPRPVQKLEMCSGTSAPGLKDSKGFAVVFTQALRIWGIFTLCKLCHSPPPILFFFNKSSPKLAMIEFMSASRQRHHFRVPEVLIKIVSIKVLSKA